MRNGRYISDYHCHSAVSPDGHSTMAEMARAAIEMGIDELCFTDHVEPVPWLRWNDGPLPLHSYDWSVMAQDFAAAQRLYGDKIKLRMGAELGEAPFALEVMESFLKNAPPLDFTIGSAHVFRREDGTVAELYWNTEPDEAMWYSEFDGYVAELERLVDWGKFTVLGHLTLPLRYAKELAGLDLSFDRYEEQLREILRRAIEKGIGIELNTNRGHDPLPGAKWLKLYRELGGEIVTMGSDAHTPDYLGCAMEENQDLLRACSFRHFTTYEQGKPTFHQL